MKTRIQLYTNEEMKRRIELAAAKYHMPVTQYCYEAVEQRLAEDKVLERETITIPLSPPKKKTKLFSEIRALREQIEARRQGEPIDVDTIIDQVREEREREILGLY